MNNRYNNVEMLKDNMDRLALVRLYANLIIDMEAKLQLPAEYSARVLTPPDYITGTMN